MAAIDLVVSGRVQGVGFRWHTRRTARRLGVTGWVANLPDGTVRVCAAGTPAQLAALEQFLRSGPPGARVDHLQMRDPDHGATLPDPFEIK